MRVLTGSLQQLQMSLPTPACQGSDTPTSLSETISHAVTYKHRHFQDLSQSNGAWLLGVYVLMPRLLFPYMESFMWPIG